MSTVQKADAGARRKALLIVAFGTVVGALLIIGFDRYRMAFLDWLVSEPEELSYRLGLICFIGSVLGSVPVFAFAIYLWSLGRRVMRDQRFPLLGQRVVRDTLILEGQAALARGRIFRIMAVSLGVAGVVLCYAFWRLVAVLSKNSA
jgi:hypothetical protein